MTIIWLFQLRGDEAGSEKDAKGDGSQTRGMLRQVFTNARSSCLSLEKMKVNTVLV